MADDKKYLNYVPLTMDAFQFAIQQANQAGLKVGDWVGRQIELSMLRGKQGTIEATNPHIQIQEALWKLQNERRTRQNVFEIAALVNEHPDNEQLAELLVNMCELADISYDEVIRQTSGENAVTSYVNYTKLQTLGSSCVKWLLDLLIKNGSLPHSSILKAGDSLGYKESTIKRAKTAINSNDPNFNIRSIHKSSEWAWELVQITPDLVVSTETVAVASQLIYAQ
jgi:hypothetical protein